MAIYKQIQEWVKKHHGFSTKPCWIADVKEQAGLPIKRAWNRIGDERKNPCPPDKINAIQEALRHLGMIE